MTIQDHRDVPHSSTLVTGGNAMSIDTGEQVLTGEGHAPKIRKPYTIIKQRERWTEEEHNKFLEALKLYGRAWRKIEDHVGTKNAVQIRSHAQKFFSKVGRESSNGDTSFIKTIEIPPPRPKRKPAHPYPRKFVPPAKKEMPLHEQSARSTSLNSAVDQENQSPTSVLSEILSPSGFYQSPTSVLSAVPSETLGSAYSNTRDGSSSPVSSVDYGNYTALPHENDPSGQENISQSDEPVPEKLDLFPKVDAFLKGGSVEATSSKRLKLFGKTLSLPDSDEPAASSPCSSKTRSLDTSEGSAPELADSEVANAENALGQRSPGLFPAAWYQNANSLMPWWAFYGNVPFPFVPMNIVNYTKVELQDRDTQREGSVSGSDEGDKKSGVESQFHERFLDFIPYKSSSSENSTRGFVPYKRSLSERETISSTMTCKENETHRIRLSL